MFESLEQRLLLSAELRSDGVVEVRGTDGNDNIRIRVADDQLVVWEDGSESSFALADVSGLEIRADDGDDTVQLEAGGRWR